MEQESDLEVLGGAEDASGALKLIERVRPDLVLLDLSLKHSNGLAPIKDLKNLYPRLMILVVSLHDEEIYAERTIRAGARGFIMKGEATERIIVAVRRVLAGDIYLSDKMQAKVLHRMASGETAMPANPLEGLSDREIEVFELMGDGMKNQAIAAKLHISIKTVETYKSHLKTKLKLNDSTELMQHAVAWNLKNNYLSEKNAN